MAGGFVGVDVFFVLSGYLISGMLIREFQESEHIGLARFYARRMARLLPVLLVALAVTVALAFWLLSSSEAMAQLASGIYATTWTSNLYFSLRELDYFNELAANDLFLHTWSLGVEEQFYLVWPVMLLAAQKVFQRSGGGHSKNRLLIFLGVVFIAGFLCSLYLSYHSPQLAFYLMPSRIWQFSLGALVYLLFTKSSESAPIQSRLLVGIAISKIFFVGGLVLVLGSAAILHPNLIYPGAWAALPSFGTAMIIFAGSNQAGTGRNILAHPVFVWLGDRSYSWYLWHWPILILGFSFGVRGQLLPTAGLVLASLLLAMASYKYVELPFWKGRYSKVSPRQSLLVAILLILLGVASFFHLLRSAPDGNIAVDPYLRLSSDTPEIYRMPCDGWYHHARIDPCTFGVPGAEKTVVMLGDSIGAQWFSSVPEIFPEPEWLTVVLTKSSCPFVDEDVFYRRIGKIYDICKEWREAVLDLLAANKPDVIVVGNASSYDFNTSQWIEGSARVFERLSAAAELVIVIPGTPSLGFDGPGCIARHGSAAEIGQIPAGACASVMPVMEVTKYLSQAADRYPNVHVLDLNDLVCPAGLCQAVNQSGVAVFRDSQHLSDTFVRSVIPAIRQRINTFDNKL